MWIISTLLLLISYLAWSIQVLLSPPLRLTRPNPQVPTIPIWVSLLPLFRRWFGLPPLGQDLLYQRYLSPRLERIGAAWIFFGGRWNLLVNDPEAIKQVLNRFEKSGNHIKIPNSVIARLTGSNIISENGQKWKKFRKVLGRPISSPPSDLVDFQTSVDNLFQRIDRSKGKDSLLVNPLLQRYSMDTLCRVLFRVDLGFLSDESPPPELHATHTLVKQNIFDPFFLSFPMLDEEPWVKLFPQRRRARSYVDRLETQLVKALTGKDRGEVSEGTGGSSQKSILLEEMSRAVMEGRWTRREFIDNVKIIFIAGHENTQQALNSLLFMLAVHQDEQERIRTSLIQAQNEKTKMEEFPLVRRFVLETLRYFPPIPQLFNRRATEDETLILTRSELETTKVVVPRGTYAGWTAYGAHRKTPGDRDFQPGRWGETLEEIDSKMRRMRSSGRFFTFHWGERSCIGSKLAMVELQVFVVRLLRRYRISLPDGKGPKDVQMTPGGLLCPRDLRIRFQPIQEVLG